MCRQRSIGDLIRAGGTIALSDVVADEQRGIFFGADGLNDRASIDRVRVQFDPAQDGSRFSAIVVFDSDAPVALRGVLIERCAGAPCVRVFNAPLELESSVLRSFQDEVAGTREAIAVSGEGALRASSVAIDGARGPALLLSDRASAALDRVRASIESAARRSSITLASGTALTARALTSVGATRVGVFALGGEATLEDALVETARDDSAVALYAARGGSLRARRIVARGTSGFVVAAQDEETTITLEDALVEGGERSRAGGWAIAALRGAHIAVSRAVIGRSSTALTAVNVGSQPRATDLFIDSLSPVDDASNASVITQLGGSIVAERVAVVRGAGAAFATLADEGQRSTLDLRDAYVAEMRLSRLSASRPEERSNVAMLVRSSSSARCARCTLRGSSFAFMVSGGELSIEDGSISESLDAAGLVQSDGPRVSLVRVALRGNARDEVLTGSLPDVSFALPTPLL